MQTTIHNDNQAWASAAATGSLSQSELEVWNYHVATCPACRQLYQEELIMRRAIEGALDAGSADPGLEGRMIRKFRESCGARSGAQIFRFPPALIAAAACCAVAGLIGLAWMIFHGKQPQQSVAQANPVQLQLPGAVLKTIQSQAPGSKISSVDRVNDDGAVSYELETLAPDGAQGDFEIAQDGALLTVETTLAQLPAVVRSAIQAAAGKDQLDGVAKLFDDGEISYAARITANGRTRDLTFDDDGTLYRMEMAMSDLPPAVQAAINNAKAQGKVEDIEQTFEDGDTGYVATISADGRAHDYTFAGDGTLASVEVDLDQLPAAVRGAALAAAGAGEIDGIDKTFDGGQVTYDATVSAPDGRERNISLSNDGRLLSRELALSETPAPVRQAIQTAIGNGRIEEIDQSFVATDRVMPFQVAGMKNGKPFDFMVGPSGAFLGTED